MPFLVGDNMLNKRLTKLLYDRQFKKFYWSKEWRAKRKEILKRDNNECQRCKAKGKVTVTNLEVHHIKHIDTHPLLALTSSNLITVCISCHNELHPEKLERFNKVKPKLDNPERW